jgi:hypothetical protein
MKNRLNPPTSQTIANARDQYRVYTFGGDLPGTALEIVVRNGGKSKRGIFRYNGRPFGEKRNERFPLGSFDKEGLAALRRKRAACERLIEEGKSPKQEHQRAHEQKLERRRLSQRTLGEAVEDFFKFARETKWKSPHTRVLNDGIKRNHLDGHPLMKIPLELVKPIDIYDFLSPFWHGYYVSRIPRGAPKANGKGLGREDA